MSVALPFDPIICLDADTISEEENPLRVTALSYGEMGLKIVPAHIRHMASRCPCGRTNGCLPAFGVASSCISVIAPGIDKIVPSSTARVSPRVLRLAGMALFVSLVPYVYDRNK